MNLATLLVLAQTLLVSKLIFEFCVNQFCPQKHDHLQIPALSTAVNKQAQADTSSIRKMVPLLQLNSLSQLVENMHRIEVISPRTNLWSSPSVVLTLRLLLPCYSASKSLLLSVLISSLVPLLVS